MKRKKKSVHFAKTVAISSVIALSTSFVSGCSKAPTQEPEKPDNNASKANAITSVSTSEKLSNPNIVYLVIDDMGFSDLGCYGSEIKTPNIDELAESGIRYNNFNVCPVSSPTRASLLTGRNANEVGMGFVTSVNLEGRPAFQGRVAENAGTVMEVLNENGYGTYGIGKYHMCPEYEMSACGPYNSWPLAEGYERYYGFLDGETDQWHPMIVSGNELIESAYDDDYTLNDDLILHAKQMIGDQVSVYPDKPFFLNFAFGASHSPLQVPQKYIDMYAGVYDKGWDVLHQERFERMKEMGIIPGDANLAPADPAVQEWASLDVDTQQLFARMMETYAGFITQTDEKVGELIDYLKATGEYDNTLFVLMSDNGATGSGRVNGSDTFTRILARRLATVEEMLPEYDLIGSEDFAAVYPMGWGRVGNTPFKGYKAGLDAGGVRAPLIISCASADFADKGTIRPQYVDVSDITPTIYDLLGIMPPEELNGITQMPISGISMANTLYDADAPETRDTQYYFMYNNSSIYHDGWKAVAKHTMGTSFEEDVWALYNVTEDYSEITDVAAEYPEKLEELKELFLAEAEKHGNNMPLQEMPFGAPSPFSPQTLNNTFKYYPEMGHINARTAPSVAQNHTITISVDRANSNVEGTLVALGDNHGGFTMYIKDNKLVYELNEFDLSYKITSNIDVPTGESVLKYVYTSTAPFAGFGELYINDQKVGECPDIITVSLLTLEGLDVGRDLRQKVNEECPDFEGTIQYVQFDTQPFVPAKE
ncbi:arylsulfatase [Dethiosulfatibacter aminovorans DSM 17477]|uniref:Arylsulfatase n=1 Tax=Dethiosulfatibacter aminovorans DSM 17477 TaxID=1121476 RepID=A0A1M6EXL7_9FIRM|nr:sulfatase-like hydrolase/transferase [Dethiosulfatibacter aminovorans]SHI90237.1 arylsulfatase [Dethiosulfatibacter aminovorans DSM 17477]